MLLPHMPFFALVDTAKYFATAFAISMGHDAKNPELIALSHDVFVGNPAVAC